MARITVTVQVWDTEDRASVIDAVQGIFPGLEMAGEMELTGTTEGLDRMRDMLRDQRIRDTARTHLRSCVRGDTLEFYLSKQIATVGKINFSDREAPLGTIRVVVEDPDLGSLIDDLTGSQEEEVME